jgi:hypothetical protein
MDPVYEFSRTRANINDKKVKCMGYTSTEKRSINERTTLLSEPNAPDLKVYYRELDYNDGTPRECLLEIYRIKDTPWPDGEPIATAETVAGTLGLNILPLFFLS